MLSNEQVRNQLDDFFSVQKPPQDAIRPASIELSVGRIIVPPSDDNASVIEVADYIIPIGGTLVLETYECLQLPATHAGLMFPKSSALAEKGILITNFGCVDPGYSGKLKFVVVNLGRQAYGIRVGDRVVTLALFKLESCANPDYQEYIKGRKRGLSIEETSRLLSHDLVQVENRARDEARKTVQDSSIWLGIILSLFVIIPGVILASAPPIISAWVSSDETSRKLDAMEVARMGDISELSQRILELENKLGAGK